MTETPALSDQERRVKVYQLNKDGQWDDKGTGYVTIAETDGGVGMEMLVQCEDTKRDLLEHKVNPEIEYNRQGDTIITWCESEGTDLALSFQEPNGCTVVWSRVAAITGQREDQDPTEYEMAIEEAPQVSLPEPSTESIEEVLKALTEAVTLHHHSRSSIVNTLLNEEGLYARKLLDVFGEFETKKDAQGTASVFEVFKIIVMLSDCRLFETLFSDDIFGDLIAVFNHDPELRDSDRHEHRAFFEQAKFKQVLEFKDEKLLARIHQNYRMTYFKDVVLMRYMDDNVISTIDSIIYYNNVGIIAHFTENPELVRELLAKIHRTVLAVRDPAKAPTKAPTSSSPPGDAKQSSTAAASASEVNLDPILYLQELCNLAKPIQVQYRKAFYTALENAEVFSSLEDALGAASPAQNPRLWHSCIDILYSTLIHDASLLRNHFMGRKNSRHSLLGRIVAVVVAPDTAAGLVHHLSEIIKTTLDPMADGMGPSSDKESFLDHFYKWHATVLVGALDHAKGRLVNYNALEILSSCTHQHGERALGFVLRNKVLERAVALLNREDTHLALGVIRLMRGCLESKNREIEKNVVRGKLLDPIIDIFVRNGARYNILNSSVIEMVEAVRKAELRDVIEYLVQTHGAKFRTIEYVSTFKMLTLEYENGAHETKEGKGGAAWGSTAAGTGRDPSSDRPDAASEYSYFESDGDGDGDEEKAPPLDLEDENDGFIPRNKISASDEKESEDLVVAISRRKKKSPKKMSFAIGRNAVSRKASEDNVLGEGKPNESPRKRRRVNPST